MGDFEKDDFRRNMLEEFEKADVFYARFKSDFNLAMTKIIKDKAETLEYDIQLRDVISIYSQEIINVSESVIDKDKNYPEYRIKEELERVQKVVGQMAIYEIDKDFVAALHHQVKVLMVDNFKGIFKLSANGFLLLELNAKMFTLRFVATYNDIVQGKRAE